MTTTTHIKRSNFTDEIDDSQFIWETSHGLPLPEKIYCWTCDIDYGHKSSIGWVYTIWGPDELDQVNRHLDEHMNEYHEHVHLIDDYRGIKGLTKFYEEEPSYEQWYPSIEYCQEITNPHAIERAFRDEGIAGYGHARLNSTDIDNIQEHFGLDPIFGPKFSFTCTHDKENPDNVGKTFEIPF